MATPAPRLKLKAPAQAGSPQLLYQTSKLYKDLREQSFGEKLRQYQLRVFHSNTRMNIKNHQYSNTQAKRDRMVAYWQQEVIPHHLPKIGKKQKLQSELQARATEKGQARPLLTQPAAAKASPPVVPRFKSL